MRKWKGIVMKEINSTHHVNANMQYMELFLKLFFGFYVRLTRLAEINF